MFPSLLFECWLSRRTRGTEKSGDVPGTIAVLGGACAEADKEQPGAEECEEGFRFLEKSSPHHKGLILRAGT